MLKLSCTSMHYNHINVYRCIDLIYMISKHPECLSHSLTRVDSSQCGFMCIILQIFPTPIYRYNRQGGISICLISSSILLVLKFNSARLFSLNDKPLLASVRLLFINDSVVQLASSWPNNFWLLLNVLCDSLSVLVDSREPRLWTENCRV